MLAKPDPGNVRAKPKPKQKPPTFAVDVSEKGLEFVGHWEGCPTNQDGTLRVYNDPYNATVGVGHLIHMGKYTAADEQHYKGWRYPDAIKLLHTDAARFVHHVNTLGLHLTQPEFDALTSAAFNLGSIPSHVVQLLHQGDKVGAMGVLRQYSHANGHVLPGLLRRRNAEADLFLHGIY